MEDFEFKIARLSLSPGDIIIFKTPGRLSSNMVDSYRASFKKVFGEDQRVLILENGIDIAVLTKADIEAMI